MTKEMIEQKFPAFFQNFTIPETAKAQALSVFRACKTQAIEKDSFLPTYVENGFQVMVGESESDPRQYSASCSAKAKALKRFVAVDSRYQPPFLLAAGVTHPDCGISCMTKEYLNETKQQRKSEHVDWWLYEDAEPWRHFKGIDYNEAE